MDTETKARAYKTSRYCPNCHGAHPALVGWHPLARTVYVHCLSCEITRALPRIPL